MKDKIKKALTVWGEENLAEDEAEEMTRWLEDNYYIVENKPMEATDAIVEHCMQQIKKYNADNLSNMFLRRAFNEVIDFIKDLTKLNVI